MTSERGHNRKSRYDAALRLMLGATPDANAARLLLEEAVADDDPRACYALATWYLHGTYVRKSLKQGARLLEVAAAGKVRDALFDLAVLYETGRGVAKDRGKAFALYSDAADLGDPQAMQEVGRMLHYGIGVAKDREAAARWLERADSATAGASVSQEMAS